MVPKMMPKVTDVWCQNAAPLASMPVVSIFTVSSSCVYFIVQYEPWHIRLDHGNGTFSYTGVLFELVNALAEAINFT